MNKPENLKPVSEDKFFFFIECQIQSMAEQVGAMMQVKAQIERALEHNFIVDFYLDEETGEIGFNVRPKGKVGFIQGGQDEKRVS